MKNLYNYLKKMKNPIYNKDKTKKKTQFDERKKKSQNLNNKKF